MYLTISLYLYCTKLETDRSPPNSAMFCCTQWSTAIWSIRPQLATRALELGEPLAFKNPVRNYKKTDDYYNNINVTLRVRNEYTTYILLVFFPDKIGSGSADLAINTESAEYDIVLICETCNCTVQNKNRPHRS